MKTIKQVLDAKGREVWSIGPDSTVREAMQLMAEKDIGALLVTDGAKPVGMITERDYSRKVALKGFTSDQLAVRQIMTEHILYVQPEQTVDEAMALMTEKRFRHFPVLDGGKVVGLVSIGDLVKATIADQQFTIEQLVHYIAG